MKYHEKPTTYSFVMQRPDGSTLTYECDYGAMTWAELVEEFTYFLRGCGFIVDGELEFISWAEQEEVDEKRRKEKWGPWDGGTDADEELVKGLIIENLAKRETNGQAENSESVGLENTTSSGKEL